MSSMPPPIATAGRGTSERTDTAWQSVIVVAECLSRGGPVNRQPARPRSRPSRFGPDPRFALGRQSHYDRSSMVVGATIFASVFAAGKPGPGIRPFAIAAPPRR